MENYETKIGIIKIKFDDDYERNIDNALKKYKLNRKELLNIPTRIGDYIHIAYIKYKE